eukprot:509740_1
MTTNNLPSMKVPSGKWQYFVGMADQDGSNRTVYVDTLNINLELHDIKSREELQILMNKHQKFREPKFIQIHNEYANQLLQYLHGKFAERSNKSTNLIYTLFIHTVTHPNSPQIWRRIKVSSQLTLEQFDQILIQCLGHTGLHSTEFQIPINTFYHHSMPTEPPYKFAKNKFQIWNQNSESVDKKCFQYLRPEITVPINRILFGQIAQLFPMKYEFQNKYPFDAFHTKYYKNDKKYKLRFKNLLCDNQMRFNNFS